MHLLALRAEVRFMMYISYVSWRIAVESRSSRVESGRELKFKQGPTLTCANVTEGTAVICTGKQKISFASVQLADTNVMQTTFHALVP